ncbi:hypothetical protein ITJ86_06605 [Winogradskyella sp. F6397]|uniref:Glycosyltransferase family 1 protein n=1 Tax=Winogradskyella marina TaxID=2785530 RepID=A0ABS0ELJ0_9FLAO|nr:hypothetical protein [Winogradskyella marina]MBF8149561.1 hypothetical protein [Winogradskyella marina]
MKPLFKCELNYFPSRHLSHIYDGFEKLRKFGVIETTLIPATTNQTKPLLNVMVNNKYRVIYDTLDGFNWINGSIDENLDYFSKNIEADFYFKRSFNNQILDHAPKNCKVFPLGLYFPFKSEGKYPTRFYEKFKGLLKENLIISKYYNKTSFTNKDFEYYPIPNRENKILFLTQLWNPDDVKLEHLKLERKLINENRIDCIKALRKEFGKDFFGGLQHNSYRVSDLDSLMLPFSMTKREAFLQTVKRHNICIATAGLHNSIGAKFGEYIAASRAIITEPIEYTLPGDFENNKNYLMFFDKYELIENIHSLLRSEDKLVDMMRRNYQYYNNYLRSDSLVLNTLLKILEK